MWGRKEIEIWSFAEVGGERPQSSTGLLLPPTPPTPPHPLWGKPARVGRNIGRGGFYTKCSRNLLWLQLKQLNVYSLKKPGFQNWGCWSKRRMEKEAGSELWRIYVTIWKAICSRYLASFAPSTASSQSSLKPNIQWTSSLEKDKSLMKFCKLDCTYNYFFSLYLCKQSENHKC